MVTKKVIVKDSNVAKLQNKKTKTTAPTNQAYEMTASPKNLYARLMYFS